MTHYICPICDLELKGGHYCPTCKKWIREPVVYHGESMPNKHGDGCYVPSSKSLKEPVANVSRDYTTQAPRRTTTPSHRPTTPTYRQSPSGKKQPASTGKSVGFFIFIIWIIIVMGILGN